MAQSQPILGGYVQYYGIYIEVTFRSDKNEQGRSKLFLQILQQDNC
jgi:hypothetical protein